jgi:hypothetical protein
MHEALRLIRGATTPGSPQVRRDRGTADLRGDLKQDVFREVVDGEEVSRSMHGFMKWD